MSLWPEQQIPDRLDDEVGQCLQKLHAIRTWTSAKAELFEQLERFT
jgi:hypothetical protein